MQILAANAYGYQKQRSYGEIRRETQINNLWHSHKELRYELVEQLFHENLKAQSRYPKRISAS